VSNPLFMFSTLSDMNKTLEVPSSASIFISASKKNRSIKEALLEKVSKMTWFSFTFSSMSTRLLLFAAPSDEDKSGWEGREDGCGRGGAVQSERSVLQEEGGPLIPHSHFARNVVAHLNIFLKDVTLLVSQFEMFC